MVQSKKYFNMSGSQNLPFWNTSGSQRHQEVYKQIGSQGPPIQSTGPPMRMQGWESV